MRDVVMTFVGLFYLLICAWRVFVILLIGIIIHYSVSKKIVKNKTIPHPVGLKSWIRFGGRLIRKIYIEDIEVGIPYRKRDLDLVKKMLLPEFDKCDGLFKIWYRKNGRLVKY